MIADSQYLIINTAIRSEFMTMPESYRGAGAFDALMAWAKAEFSVLSDEEAAFEVGVTPTIQRLGLQRPYKGSMGLEPSRSSLHRTIHSGAGNSLL